MRILAIETSCDETASAIVEDGHLILSNVVASQVSLHRQTGGIVPEVASRAHIEKIIPVIKKTLTKTKKIPDAIAVTVGPGLIGSLLIGVNTAKALCYAWNKPLIAVNHLEGHLYANWLLSKQSKFPCLHLLVSGGHTMLIWQENHGKLKIIGETRDDAAGEAFDKTARLLDLPYPGGAELSRLAEKGDPKAFNFPRAMLKQNNFDFSFSGLKTAVRNKLESLSSLNTLTPQVKADLSASIQMAIVDALVEKSLLAVRKYTPRSFAISGGVSANKVLREKAFAKIGKLVGENNFHIPPIKYCTDNAAMIAACAFYNQNFISPFKVLAIPDLSL